MKNNIVFLGDSIMQENGPDTYPQTGWPQGLTDHLKKGVSIVNLAKNGRSTKSYITEGLLGNALKYISENSYVVIGFGHNDEKIEDETRYTMASTSFKENIRFMVKEIKKRGGDVIITSPVTRRKINDNGLIEDASHHPYTTAIEEISKELNITYINLYKLSVEYFNSIGYNESRRYYMNFDKDIYPNYLDGKSDNSHLTIKGAEIISELFIKEIKRINHPLYSLFTK